MPKKNLIILILGIVFVLVVSLFIYAYWRVERQKAGNVDDFVIKETSEGIVVENKREKIKFILPNDWRAEKEHQSSANEWGVMLYSPNSKFVEKFGENRDLPWIDEGYTISLSILAGDTLAAYSAHLYLEIFEEEGYPPKKPIEEHSDDLQIVEINGRLGVKSIPIIHPELGLVFDIDFPLNRFKIFNIYLICAPASVEQCVPEFKEILEAAEF